MNPYVIIYDEDLGLEDILRRMEHSAVPFLAVVDKAGKLLGSISESEIRRAILTHTHQIGDILNPYPHKRIAGAEEQLPKGGFRHPLTPYLPVVDHEMRLIDVEKIELEQVAKKKNKVVLMVGGLGKRLGELTRELPKPMLPLGHKPILQLILESFLSYGFRDFYFCVNYKSEAIKEYFGRGESFGTDITYVEEHQALGTAGPLSLIEESFEEPFIVMNGDLITTLNFESLLNFHLEKGGLATMCIHEYNYQLPFGVVHTRNARILSLEEKPRQKCFVNAGIYVLEPQALSYLSPRSHTDMTTLFERMMQADEVLHSYFINEFWMDIGQVEDYESTKAVFNQYNL